MKFKKDEADQHRIVVGKVVVLLGLVVHLLHSLSTCSIITDQWLESTGIVPDALKAEKNASMIRWNSNVSILTTNKTIVSPNVLHRHRPIDDQRLTTFAKENEFQDLRAPLFSNRIQLLELVQTGSDPQCHSTDNHNMSLFHSIILDESMTHIPKRQIPKIIHMTSKSRCMTQKVKANILKWRLPGYSIYFHDDAAVNRLLEKYFPAFPHLQMIKECSISGAAKADIWRYLVLWEYGGVYTGKFKNNLLRNAHIIFLFSR